MRVLGLEEPPWQVSRRVRRKPAEAGPGAAGGDHRLGTHSALGVCGEQGSVGT